MRKPGKIEHGVNPYDGIFASWYGWARRRGDAGEPRGFTSGNPRLFKMHARIDALRLAWRLRRG